MIFWKANGLKVDDEGGRDHPLSEGIFRRFFQEKEKISKIQVQQLEMVVLNFSLLNLGNIKKIAHSSPILIRFSKFFL